MDLGTDVSYLIETIPPFERNDYVYNRLLVNVAKLTNSEHTLRVNLLKAFVGDRYVAPILGIGTEAEGLIPQYHCRPALYIEGGRDPG